MGTLAAPIRKHQQHEVDSQPAVQHHTPHSDMRQSHARQANLKITVFKQGLLLKIARS
jgi:hypothetical protein